MLSKEIIELFEEYIKEKSIDLDISHFSKYHLEGTVRTHTYMVLNEVLKSDLSDSEKKIFSIVALLHDIGKYLAKTEIKDKVVFQGHEGLSTVLAIEFLERLQKLHVNGYEIRRILLIVNHHGLFLNNQKNLEKLLSRNTLLWEDLIKFHQFDKNGSMTFEKNFDLIESIKLQTPQDLIDPNLPKVYMMVGLPCSGKSTLAKNLKWTTEAEIISRDDLVMERANGKTYTETFKSLSKEEHQEIDNQLLKKYNSLVKQKKDIILDLTNLSFKSRRKWFRNTHQFHIVAFLTSYQTILKRNSERFFEGKMIDYDVLINQMKRFQLPLLNEHQNVAEVVFKL
jgi:predicted kinase/CRISPR/Cas system-associated endonuclease Cas3-HD